MVRNETVGGAAAGALPPFLYAGVPALSIVNDTSGGRCRRIVITGTSFLGSRSALAQKKWGPRAELDQDPEAGCSVLCFWKTTRCEYVANLTLGYL